MSVMRFGITFILLAALFRAMYDLFLKKAATTINPFLSASIVGAVIVVFCLPIFFVQKQFSADIVVSQKGILFAILIGIIASVMNVSVQVAYSRGLPLTVGSPILLGGSLIIGLSIGILLLGEELSFVKLAGFIFVLLGVLLLSGIQK